MSPVCFVTEVRSTLRVPAPPARTSRFPNLPRSACADLRPFRFALLCFKGGDTPQLALATPRLRQVAFGMYVTCHCHNKGNSKHKEETSMSKTSTTPRPNIYQIVTDRIVQSLKAGIIPWEKPWPESAFHRRPIPPQFPHRQALSRHQCSPALVRLLRIAFLAHVQTGC